MFTPQQSEQTAKWISENYYLPSEAGDLDGLYNFYYTPYFLGVAAALDDESVCEVDLMKASQIGWSYFVIGYILKRVKEASTGKQCPIVILFAKEKDGKAFHDEKLVPTVPVNRCMDGVLDISVSRKSGNRWDFKRFINGFMKLVGSNSPGNVKSTSSVGLAIIEEPDDTSDDVKNQGDSIGNIEERVKRYQGSKLIVGGTPSLKGFSKIEQRIKLSDARVLPIACHECDQKHVLSFDNVNWIGKNGDIPADPETGEVLAQPHEIYGYAQPETAVYTCPHCGAEWDDYQRKKNIRETVFKAEAAGDPLKGWVQTKPFHGRAGFVDLPEVYCCLNGATLAQLAMEFLNAEHQSERGDEKERIKFVNQKLGQPYEFKADQAEPDQLREAARDYRQNKMPPGALLVSVGIDVQHDRAAVIKRAWGRDQESWCLHWDEIHAEHSTVDVKDAVWESLEHEVFGLIESEEGWHTVASAVTIDCSDGTTSAAVYEWVRKMAKKYPKVMVMAGKGSSSQTDPEVFSTPRLKSIDHKNPKRQTKADRHGVKVYIIGTNKAKDWIFGQMNLEIQGLGRWHYYQGIRSDYYEQITGEVKVPHRTIPGKKVYQQKAGAAVEALDCEVYARHAAMAKRVHLLTPNQWDEIEVKLRQSDLFSSANADQNLPAPVREKTDRAALAQKLNG